MSKRFERQILLCITGTTPQVVTETLWALHQQGEKIDEIRVITTLEGRHRLRRQLLEPETGRFYAFCRDYGIDPQSISFGEQTISLLRFADGRVIEDIQTPEENLQAANQICEIVRQLTIDEKTRVFASTAGGRKTMSVYLTTGMQLFARSWDSLSHVLVSPEFETLDDFYYIPPGPLEIAVTPREAGKGETVRTLSTASAAIHLVPIEFIRLRGILGKTNLSEGTDYASLVGKLQSDLDLMERSCDLRIDLRQRTVEVSGRRAKLTRRELFYFLLFAWYRQNDGSDGDGFRDIDRITPDDLDSVFRLITRADNDEVGLEESESLPGYHFLGTLSRQTNSNPTSKTGQLDKENAKKLFREVRSRINRKLTMADIPERYQLAVRTVNEEKTYGLNISPEMIDWSGRW